MPRVCPLIRIVCMLTLVMGLGIGPGVWAAADDRPNILLIFSDDAGYRDFSFQGSPQFKTPRLDRLAAEGVVCTNAYVSASVCGPSRAGLITGQYQQRFGYFRNPGVQHSLPTTEPTFGDALKAQGYRTGLIGKWHMGSKPDEHPNQRGFDDFYGFLAGHRSYFPYKPTDQNWNSKPFRLMHNDQVLDESEMDFYITDLLTDQAIEFMGQSQRDGKPFFLYLSHLAVHGPMHAREDDLKPYEHLPNEKRRNLGAMTAALDRSTGRLIDWLEENNLRSNTLVIFTNDNGGGKPDYINANNYPLRGWKGEEWEGGIRVPFIASWPGKVPQGQRYDAPIISLDLFPTFLTVAGGDPDRHTKPLAGVNLLPYFSGEKTGEPHEALFWQRVNAAVRVGDWKLHQRNTPDAAEPTYLLFNLAEDVGEKNNVIDNHPEVAADLKARLLAWQAQNPEPLW